MRRVPPSKQTVRFVVAALLGFIPIGTALMYELGLESVPAVATAITMGGAVTRVMSMDATEKWLDRYAPWLSAEDEEEPHNDSARDSNP